jgi:hypothetical protein
MTSPPAARVAPTVATPTWPCGRPAASSATVNPSRHSTDAPVMPLGCVVVPRRRSVGRFRPPLTTSASSGILSGMSDYSTSYPSLRRSSNRGIDSVPCCQTPASTAPRRALPSPRLRAAGASSRRRPSPPSRHAPLPQHRHAIAAVDVTCQTLVDNPGVIGQFHGQWVHTVADVVAQTNALSMG